MGKSNLLESLYLCGFGRSFRGRSQQYVRFDEDFARIDAENPQAEKIQFIILPDGQKNIMLNNTKISRFSKLLGKFPIIYIGPDEVQVIAGSPDNRRNIMDFHISQFDPDYVDNLSNYLRSIRQRNAALKGVARETVAGGMILIDSWDEKIANHGAKIIQKRIKFLQNIAPISADIYSAISGNENSQITLRYNCSIAENPMVDNLEEIFLKKLRLHRKRDIDTFQTTFGPHRDDIDIELDGLPARKFASWGQVRMIALSIFFSVAQMISEHIGRIPTILMDDALAELDPVRAKSVLEIAPQFGQIMVATPHPAHLIDNDSFRQLKFTAPGKIEVDK